MLCIFMRANDRMNSGTHLYTWARELIFLHLAFSDMHICTLLSLSLSLSFNPSFSLLVKSCLMFFLHASLSPSYSLSIIALAFSPSPPLSLSFSLSPPSFSLCLSSYISLWFPYSLSFSLSPCPSFFSSSHHIFLFGFPILSPPLSLSFPFFLSLYLSFSLPLALPLFPLYLPLPLSLPLFPSLFPSLSLTLRCLCIYIFLPLRPTARPPACLLLPPSFLLSPSPSLSNVFASTSFCLFIPCRTLLSKARKTDVTFSGIITK